MSFPNLSLPRSASRTRDSMDASSNANGISTAASKDNQDHGDTKYAATLRDKHPLFRRPSDATQPPQPQAKRAASLSLAPGPLPDAARAPDSAPEKPADTAAPGKHARALTDPPQKHSATNDAARDAKQSAYVCPICAQASKNLLQLNHHLDTVHSISASISPPTSDDDADPGKQLLDWFKKTGENASRVLKETGQNLGIKKGVSMDVLNQIAITTDTIAATSSAAVMAPRDGSNFDLNPHSDDDQLYTTDGSVSAAAAAAGFVTRKHWQKDQDTMKCNVASCSKLLVPSGVKMGKMVVGAAGVGAIRVHCRKCGQVFCEEHVGFQMRLRAHDAKHDSQNGFWCRVCQSCFTSKEGYYDFHGVTRTRTATFLKFRSTMSDVVSLEMNKLESRYEKLAVLYQDIPTKPPSRTRTLTRLTSTFSNTGPSTRHIDQSVVAWQEDTEVASCPICSSNFSNLFNPLNRRHHCRLCGRVVCGMETCLSSIPLIPRETAPQTSSIGSPTTLEDTGEKSIKPAEVKVCLDCKKLVFRRKNSVLDQLNKPEVVSLYHDFLQLKLQVEELLPKFNNLIMQLSSQNTIRMEDKEYIIASKHRKNLMDYFAEMEKLGKRIKAISPASSQHQKVQDSIQIAIIQFLQSHMFTLSLMPKVTSSMSTTGGTDKIQIVSFADMQRLNEASKTLEVMEAQEATLRAQLEDAVKKRRLEDAGALREALDDVEAEVVKLKEEVNALKMGV
ncbi:FYVE zinc finger-domain-containing protein [Obelidium mucronatum]|nr:FYVE zinc finger-domain-containing protein [Obelidium mucronatum]